MEYVSEQEYERVCKEAAERAEKARKVRNRKARLRNGTAKCGQSLADKLAYLNA
jgi:hypothetical protein